MTEPRVLTAVDFGDFYAAVHGHRPFPWQEQVAGRVLLDGEWPDLIDVPTGLGKTSMIDVAVFVAAATAQATGPERVGRRRTLFVVDRRIVVDEAYDHALKLAQALGNAEQSTEAPSILRAVAGALRSFAPDWHGDLLPVTRMRGGATWDSAWLERPDVPGVVLATVDQVGSRLLFRGYGVSERRRPLDAALTGTDSLLLVDEAHLSTALLTTVDALQKHDRLGVPVPGLAVVQLSATGAQAKRPYVLNLADHEANPVAMQRLNAAKTLTAVEVKSKDVVKAIAGAAVKAVQALTSTANAPAVLVVCNTVDRARLVHERLVREFSAKDGTTSADCELLIGRSRPLDRPLLHQKLLAGMGIGRGASERPLLLVATQTVEVGINLDADALVTESASWDAVVQRLGRLNRLGTFTDRFPAHAAAPAVVVHDGQAEGPVYGIARDAMWATLQNLLTTEPAGLSASPLACRRLSAEHFNSPEHRRHDAYVPVVQTPTLETWAQTAPTPIDDVPVEPFLHGVDSGPAGVLVAWRSGLEVPADVIDPFDDKGAERGPEEADQILTAIPVRSGEQVEVPFLAVRRWINRLPSVPVSDVEGVTSEDTRLSAVPDPFRVLARRVDRGAADPNSGSATRWRWIEPQELRPGDEIVVPIERGGLDRYGWAPASTAPVRDVSEAATFEHTRSARATGTLRLDVELPARLGIDGVDANAVREKINEAVQDASNLHALIQELAQALPGAPPDLCGWSMEAWARLRALLGAAPRLVPVQTAPVAFLDGVPSDTLVILLTGPIPTPARHQGLTDRDDEDVTASSVGVDANRVTLQQHHAAVRARAGEIARALALPPDLVTVLEDAAGWHDLGKVEDRFQAMLHGGDEMAALIAPEPLAKSGMDAADRLSWRRARVRSGLPAGARHEAWSAALVRAYLNERDHDAPVERDDELLIHLIASHHGHARPLLPLVIDRDPRSVEALIGDTKVSVDSQDVVDLDHPARFTSLNARYGHWGLALLESVVRCADMTVSAEGS